MGTYTPIRFYNHIKTALAPPAWHHACSSAPAAVAIPSCSMVWPLILLTLFYRRVTIIADQGYYTSFQSNFWVWKVYNLVQ